MEFGLIIPRCQLLINFIADAPKDNNPFSLSPLCIIQAVNGPLSPPNGRIKNQFSVSVCAGLRRCHLS